MLTELKLSNFRIFEDDVTVRFRPITVLIGRNSSGKSTIIKFLLMLQQSLGAGTSEFLNPEGDRVSLGAFPALKNSLTRKRNLSFELAAKSLFAKHDFETSTYLRSFQDVKHANLVYKASATVSYSRIGTSGRSSYWVEDEVSGKNYLSINRKILDDSVFLMIGHYNTEAVNNLEVDSTTDNLDSVVLYDSKLEQLKRRHESLSRSLAEHEILTSIGHEISSIRHLSPVRAESQRVIIASPPPANATLDKMADMRSRICNR